MRALILLALSLLLLGSMAAAAQITGHVLIVQPVQKQIFEGEVLDLGLVGPGQKVELEISRSSNIYDFRNVEEVWDRLKIDDSTLPDFWRSEYSLRYEANPRAFVIVDTDAPDGDYEFSVHTERDYGDASSNPVRFRARIRVSRDVLDLQVLSKNVNGGVEQPSEFTIKLANKGSANDAFELEVFSGLPNEWRFKKQIFIPHNSEKIVPYELVAKEQIDEQIVFRATSLSSTSIADSDFGSLSTRSSLVQDMKSVGNGVLLFPNIEMAVYYLMGFIASSFF